MAPELLRGGKYSEQSDIYALGIIKGEIPSDAPQSIQSIIEQCWKDEPNERTNLESVLEEIRENKVKTQQSDSRSSEDISKGFGNSQSLQVPVDSAQINLEDQITEQTKEELRISIEQLAKK
ncbi:hypothetical protein C1645_744743 [Glomus cerebriforme]|uniref:Serine-threonine/tyrosine-protein kinase catalytic domain-containing protein n=1 Tax=Glomus cerebriforme TaxID=658196 RepID=A0A397S3Z7_9GLOM|nr:hypothetical protein C1645_745470 [Glomus cerebriforme]RIA81143.1 hypothetical protein C1645_744743 [Glomus cerebriforme]